MPRLLARPHVVLALFALLSAVHTWPLSTAPGRLSRNDNADTELNEWIVAWVAHQAATDPRHLFDANIFFPEANTLAYSESLIVPAAMGAPALWLGASPVLTYNLLILAGLTLTGWSGWLLVRRWTGDEIAGLVAGVMLTFNAHTLTRLPQLQALHLEFLPLALLAFDALLTEPRTRHAAMLALWFALQGLTSFYALIFTTTALLVGGLARPEEWWGSRARRLLPFVGLAALLALVAIVPALWPYARLGQVRPLDEVAAYSATWRDYLTTPARVHYSWWSSRVWGSAGLFPGMTSLILSAAAVALGLCRRDRRARMALAFGAVGVALSFGPALPGYATLYHALPPLQGIRNAARFGYLAIVACAILSGFAVAEVRTRWRSAGWMPAFAALVLLAANVDAFSAPLGLVDAARPSRLHARLRHTDSIVAEFPFFTPDRVFHNADYLLDSAANWRPMLNGYSGVVPDSYAHAARDLAHFPDAGAIAALRAAGVTHVFVHDRALRDWTDNETADAVPRAPGLRLLATDGDTSLYEVRRAGSE
jgi:hypothetical protein